MFGNPGAFVNGSMFMGLFGADVGVRLDEQSRSGLLAIEGSGSFGPPERPMREYVTLPPRWRSDVAAAALWVQRTLDHVAAMPPKQP